MAFNVMKQNNNISRQASEKEERLTKRFVNMLLNSSFRLCQAGFNTLKANNQIEKLRDNKLLDRKQQLTKDLCKFMMNSAIGMQIIGLRKLRENNDNINGLLERQKKLVRILNSVINSNDK